MKNFFVVLLPLFIAACALPTVDQTAASFDQTKYTTDLNNCRGGTLVEASTRTIGIAMAGSALGALHGASLGALGGEGWEGAAIGAVVGGTIGIGAGAVEAVDKHEAEIIGCLREKGYSVGG